ncbi:UNVERIFIED_CONTAM: hypothetical protein FKN15_000302 [Acipenser sinensis]
MAGTASSDTDALYVCLLLRLLALGEVTVAVLSLCKQEAQEGVQGFALWLQELLNGLKKRDPGGIGDEDVHLSNHDIAGCKQEAQEGVQGFALWLQELLNGLKKRDPGGIGDEDVHLSNHDIAGLLAPGEVNVAVLSLYEEVAD